MMSNMQLANFAGNYFARLNIFQKISQFRKPQNEAHVFED